MMRTGPLQLLLVRYLARQAEAAFVPSVGNRIVAHAARSLSTSTSSSTVRYGTSDDDPPTYSVVDNNDDDETSPVSKMVKDGAPLTKDRNDEVDDDPWSPVNPTSPVTKRKPKVRTSPRNGSSTASTSWMDKNAKFTNGNKAPAASTERFQRSKPFERRSSDKYKSAVQQQEQQQEQIISKSTTSFHQDFRGTRVFIQHIPPQASWQDLKDHCKDSLDAAPVFCSISVDRATGESKGHGIVQFETTDEATKAIRELRHHPFMGAQLYARADVQEDDRGQVYNSQSKIKGPTPPSKWRFANDEDPMEVLSEDEYQAIRSIIKARDSARRRKNYDASDDMREELKHQYRVHLDDRLKMWWVSTDLQPVPPSIHDIRGEGGWKAPSTSWRQIPITPELDLCVDPDYVEGLLKQRDIARREKDFDTADKLLEMARTSPDGDLNLRIHDESRTWRVWTDEKPIFSPEKKQKQLERKQRAENDFFSPQNPTEGAAEECLALCREFAPEKLDEIRTMLEKFPGREDGILQKLRDRFLL